MPYDMLFLIAAGVLLLTMIMTLFWFNALLREKNREVADLRHFAT